MSKKIKFFSVTKDGKPAATLNLGDHDEDDYTMITLRNADNSMHIEIELSYLVGSKIEIEVKEV